MNPSPSQIAQIRAFAATLPGGLAGTANADVLAAMRAATVANPVKAAPAVPRPFTAADLVDACSAANRPALGPYLIGAAALVIAQDGPHLAAALQAMAAIGAISAADAAAMAAVATATRPDPSWTAEVPWDAGTLGRPADDYDLEAARHA